MVGWTTRTPRLAIALYLACVGLAIVVLSLRRSPADAAFLLRGALVGVLVIHTAAPALSYGSRTVYADVGRWLLSLLMTALTLYPRALFLPLIPLDFFVAGAAVFATLVTAGLVVTAVESARTIVRLIATIAERGQAMSTVRAVLAAEIAAAIGIAALVLTDRIAWVDPPFSWPVSTAGNLVLLGFGAAALARTIDTFGSGLRSPSAPGTWFAPATVAIAMFACSAGASTAFPNGLWPSSIAVESADPSDRTRVESFLRTGEHRTGLRGTGERFIVRIGPGLVPAPANSFVNVLPNGAIEILLNQGLPADRVHNYLTVQIARALAGMRLPLADPAVVDGFAYWASQNTRNPFFAGVASGAAPESACTALPSMQLLSSETFYYADASLPFVHAEDDGGIRAAQALALQLADDADARVSLRRLIEGECDAFARVHEASPEIVIDAPPDRPDLASDVLPREWLAYAKTRSGLDAYGRPFLIRYATPSGGLQMTTDYSRLDRTLVIVSPALSVADRRTALLSAFVASFLAVRYEGIAPALFYGYADWASSDPTNPFLGGRQNGDTPRGACEFLRQADFATMATKGAVWLSALPFIVAEGDGGVTAAKQLLDEVVKERPLDVARWRSRITAGCGRVLAAAVSQ